MANTVHKNVVVKHENKQDNNIWCTAGVAAVATHGTGHITTLVPIYPWIKDDIPGGTSFAAPAVAGEAALLMQVNTS